MQSVPEVCIICSYVPSFLPHSNFIALHLPCRGGWGRPGGRGGEVGVRWEGWPLLIQRLGICI